jgi:hypothetical protein
METSTHGGIDLESYLLQLDHLHRAVATLAMNGFMNTEIWEPPMPAPERIPIYVEAEPSTSITLTQFRNYADAAELTTGVATRYWHSAQEEVTYHLYRQSPKLRTTGRIDINERRGSETIDLDLVLSCLRTLESGDVHMHGFGVGSWNLFAKIINSHMSDPKTQKPVILDWQAGIHNKFRSSVDEVRYHAADQLEDLYRQTEAAFRTL